MMLQDIYFQVIDYENTNAMQDNFYSTAPALAQHTVN